VLGEILNSYIRHLTVRSKKSSVRSASSHAYSLLSFFGSDFHPDGLDQQRLDRYAQRRLDQGLSPATVNGHFRTLRAALRLAGLGTRVKLLRVTKQLPTKLSDQELNGLLVAAGADTPAELAILLAAYAGLRHQEIMHLQRRDVDFLTKEVLVTAKEWNGGEWSPKNHEERAIPFSPAGRLSHALAARCWDLASDGWLFPGCPRTKPRKSVDEEIREAFKHARLYDPAKKPGLHMLRRTFASNLLARGVDVNTVREMGGWADLDVVMRYLSSSSELKRAAVDRLEEAPTK
jgi:integrase